MKRRLKTISLFLIAGFLVHDVAWAAPEISAIAVTLTAPKITEIRFPEDTAKVSETHSAGGGARLLIHIQDAHANLGAQRNIAKALDELITRHKVSTVFVEGGTRDDSLTYLRPLAPKPVRERVAKKYLLMGELSGAEYLNLSSDHDMRLWGVEESSLYDRNLRAYADVARDREKVLAFTDEIGKRAEKLKRQFYPVHILALEDFLKKFRKEEKKFAEYYDRLSDAAAQGGINLLGYPAFLELKDLKAREEAIDFKKANEKDPVELKKYEAYLEAFSRLDLTRLLDETRTLEDEIFRRSFSDPQTLYLYEISERLKNLKTLFSLQASKDDFERYLEYQKNDRFHTLALCAFLNRKLMDAGDDSDVIAYIPDLEQNKKNVEEFYRLTQQRDEVMVQKTLEKMSAENIRAAALITGGYHTQNLKRLLRERGVSYAVVSPVVTQENNSKRYERILLGQLGKEGAANRGHLSYKAFVERPVERVVRAEFSGLPATLPLSHDTGEESVLSGRSEPKGSRLAAEEAVLEAIASSEVSNPAVLGLIENAFNRPNTLDDMNFYRSENVLEFRMAFGGRYISEIQELFEELRHRQFGFPTHYSARGRIKEALHAKEQQLEAQEAASFSEAAPALPPPAAEAHATVQEFERMDFVSQLYSVGQSMKLAFYPFYRVESRQGSKVFPVNTPLPKKRDVPEEEKEKWKHELLQARLLRIFQASPVVQNIEQYREILRKYKEYARPSNGNGDGKAAAWISGRFFGEKLWGEFLSVLNADQERDLYFTSYSEDELIAIKHLMVYHGTAFDQQVDEIALWIKSAYGEMNGQVPHRELFSRIEAAVGALLDPMAVHEFLRPQLESELKLQIYSQLMRKAGFSEQTIRLALTSSRDGQQSNYNTGFKGADQRAVIAAQIDLGLTLSHMETWGGAVPQSYLLKANHGETPEDPWHNLREQTKLLESKVRDVVLPGGENVYGFSEDELARIFDRYRADVSRKFLTEAELDSILKDHPVPPDVQENLRRRYFIRQEMLLRGEYLVSLTAFPPDVQKLFVETAFKNGVDIFRIFDATNDADNIVPVIRIAKEFPQIKLQPVVHVHPEYERGVAGYLALAKEFVKESGDQLHALVIKDAPGAMGPELVFELVKALRADPETQRLPLVVHTHDTNGDRILTFAEAARANHVPGSSAEGQPSIAFDVALVKGNAVTGRGGLSAPLGQPDAIDTACFFHGSPVRIQGFEEAHFERMKEAESRIRTEVIEKGGYALTPISSSQRRSAVRALLPGGMFTNFIRDILTTMFKGLSTTVHKAFGIHIIEWLDEDGAPLSFEDSARGKTWRVTADGHGFKDALMELIGVEMRRVNDDMGKISSVTPTSQWMGQQSFSNMMYGVMADPGNAQGPDKALVSIQRKPGGFHIELLPDRLPQDRVSQYNQIRSGRISPEFYNYLLRWFQKPERLRFYYPNLNPELVAYIFREVVNKVHGVDISPRDVMKALEADPDDVESLRERASRFTELLKPFHPVRDALQKPLVDYPVVLVTHALMKEHKNKIPDGLTREEVLRVANKYNLSKFMPLTLEEWREEYPELKDDPEELLLQILFSDPKQYPYLKQQRGVIKDRYRLLQDPGTQEAYLLDGKKVSRAELTPDLLREQGASYERALYSMGVPEEEIAAIRSGSRLSLSAEEEQKLTPAYKSAPDFFRDFKGLQESYPSHEWLVIGRHMESTSNLFDVLQSYFTFSPPTLLGLIQRYFMARFLKAQGVRFDRVIASDLDRAASLAEPVAGQSGLQVDTLRRMREIVTLPFGGINKHLVSGPREAQRLAFMRDPEQYSIPGYSGAQFAKSARELFFEDIPGDGKKVTFIGTHGMTILVSLLYLLNIPAKKYEALFNKLGNSPNVGLTVLSYDPADQKWKLWLYADNSYLPKWTNSKRIWNAIRPFETVHYRAVGLFRILLRLFGHQGFDRPDYFPIVWPLIEPSRSQVRVLKKMGYFNMTRDGADGSRLAEVSELLREFGFSDPDAMSVVFPHLRDLDVKEVKKHLIAVRKKISNDYVSIIERYPYFLGHLEVKRLQNEHWEFLKEGRLEEAIDLIGKLKPYLTIPDDTPFLSVILGMREESWAALARTVHAVQKNGTTELRAKLFDLIQSFENEIYAASGSPSPVIADVFEVIRDFLRQQDPVRFDWYGGSIWEKFAEGSLEESLALSGQLWSAKRTMQISERFKPEAEARLKTIPSTRVAPGFLSVQIELAVLAMGREDGVEEVAEHLRNSLHQIEALRSKLPVLWKPWLDRWEGNIRSKLSASDAPSTQPGNGSRLAVSQLPHTDMRGAVIRALDEAYSASRYLTLTLKKSTGKELKIDHSAIELSQIPFDELLQRVLRFLPARKNEQQYEVILSDPDFKAYLYPSLSPVRLSVTEVAPPKPEDVQDLTVRQLADRLAELSKPLSWRKKALQVLWGILKGEPLKHVFLLPALRSAAAVLKTRQTAGEIALGGQVETTANFLEGHKRARDLYRTLSGGGEGSRLAADKEIAAKNETLMEDADRLLTDPQVRAIREELIVDAKGVSIGSVVGALHEAGIFGLMDGKKVSMKDLLSYTQSRFGGANEGYLGGALGALESEGLLTREIPKADVLNPRAYLDNTQFTLTDRGRQMLQLAPDYVKASEFIPVLKRMTEYLFGPEKTGPPFTADDDQKFTALLERTRSLKKAPSPSESAAYAANHIEGMLVGPIEIAIRRHLIESGHLDLEEPFTLAELGGHTDRLAAAFEFLAGRNFVRIDGDRFQFTNEGIVALSKAGSYGVPASYNQSYEYPVNPELSLSVLRTLLFGSKADLARIREKNGQSIRDAGLEWLVDRDMNIWGSEKAHETYKALLKDALIALFNLPIDQQPKVFSGMGVGTGWFEVFAYETMKEGRSGEGTVRWRNIETHPLIVLGADLNAVSLLETAQNYQDAGIPHYGVIQADISKLEEYRQKVDRKLAELQRDHPELYRGKTLTSSDAFFETTMLIHNRPFVRPGEMEGPGLSDEEMAQLVEGLEITEIFTDPDGNFITIFDYIQNLYKHFAGWRELGGNFGLLTLELFSVYSKLAAKNPKRSLDASYRWSHIVSNQLLARWKLWAAVAEKAGLISLPETQAVKPDKPTDDLGATGVFWLVPQTNYAFLREAVQRSGAPRVEGSRLAQIEFEKIGDTLVRFAESRDLDAIAEIQKKSPAPPEIHLTTPEIAALIQNGQVLLVEVENNGQRDVSAAIFINFSDGRITTYADIKDPAKHDPNGKNMYDFWVIRKLPRSPGGVIMSERIVKATVEYASQAGKYGPIAFSRPTDVTLKIPPKFREKNWEWLKKPESAAYRAKVILRDLVVTRDPMNPKDKRGRRSTFLRWLESSYPAEQLAYYKRDIERVLNPTKTDRWDPAKDSDFIRLTGLLLAKYRLETGRIPVDVTLGGLHSKLGAVMVRIHIGSRPEDMKALGANVEMDYSLTRLKLNPDQMKKRIDREALRLFLKHKRRVDADQLGSRLAAQEAAAVQAIQSSFTQMWDSFKKITDDAEEQFAGRKWERVHEDAETRIGLYPNALDVVENEVRGLLGPAADDEAAWVRMKDMYLSAVQDRYKSDLMLIYFYSVMRRILNKKGIAVEYSDDGLSNFRDSRRYQELFRTFVPDQRGLRGLLRDILESHDFRGAAYEDIERDSALAAVILGNEFPDLTVERAEVLKTVFYRNKGAYLVGILVIGGKERPLLIPLTNGDGGIRVDAVLTDEISANSIFSNTRANFHVRTESYRELVDFLSRVLPWRERSELYSSIGFIHPAKLELVRDLRAHLAGTSEKLGTPPGTSGTAMIAFAPPSFPYLFKIVRDKSYKDGFLGREGIMKLYRYVHLIDRFGAMLDPVIFRNLRFKRTEVDPVLLERLLQEASETVSIDGEWVMFKVLIAQRKVVPLDIYLNDPEISVLDKERALVNYGYTVKALAMMNIWPGDLSLKNFGVTHFGRVVNFDYDDYEPLTSINFIQSLPAPRNEEEEMLPSEEWMVIRPGDVFMSELEYFIRLPSNLVAAYMEHHDYFFDAAAWRQIQEGLKNKVIPDFFPYNAKRRLANVFPEAYKNQGSRLAAQAPSAGSRLALADLQAAIEAIGRDFEPIARKDFLGIVDRKRAFSIFRFTLKNGTQHQGEVDFARTRISALGMGPVALKHFIDTFNLGDVTKIEVLLYPMDYSRVPWILGNETGIAETMEILSKAPNIAQGGHFGVGGWFNLDVMAARKSRFGVLFDKNPEMVRVHGLTLEILAASKDRQDFVRRFAEKIAIDAAAYDWEFREGQKDQSILRDELTRPGSWLSSDENFDHIWTMAAEGRILSLRTDVRNTAVFAAIAVWMQRRGLRSDTVYLSNILDWLSVARLLNGNIEENRRLYFDSIGRILGPSTHVVEAHEIPLAKGRPIEQRVSTGSDFLSRRAVPAVATDTGSRLAEKDTLRDHKDELIRAMEAAADFRTDAGFSIYMNGTFVDMFSATSSLEGVAEEFIEAVEQTGDSADDYQIRAVENRVMIRSIGSRLAYGYEFKLAMKDNIILFRNGKEEWYVWNPRQTHSNGEQMALFLQAVGRQDLDINALLTSMILTRDPSGKSFIVQGLYVGNKRTEKGSAVDFSHGTIDYFPISRRLLSDATGRPFNFNSKKDVIPLAMDVNFTGNQILLQQPIPKNLMSLKQIQPLVGRYVELVYEDAKARPRQKRGILAGVNAADSLFGHYETLEVLLDVAPHRADGIRAFEFITGGIRPVEKDQLGILKRVVVLDQARRRVEEPVLSEQSESKGSRLADVGAMRMIEGLPRFEDLSPAQIWGKNFVIRANQNVRFGLDGSPQDPARLLLNIPIMRRIIDGGGTVVLLGHNGRANADPAKDDRQSLKPTADFYVGHGLPAVWHARSINNENGVAITREDVVPGKVNVIENVRFADDFESGQKQEQFAKDLASLGDYFIFEGYGDLHSSGASVQRLPLFMERVFIGPETVKELERTDTELSKPIDAFLFGSGPKVEEKAAFVKIFGQMLAPGGFGLFASSPTANLHKIQDTYDALKDKVILAEDFSDGTRSDIGESSIRTFIAKLDTLQSGQRVLVNGTMGWVDKKDPSGEIDPSYQRGTREIFHKLKELAERGVTIILVGGDTNTWAHEFGLDAAPNVVIFSGGGVPLSILAGEELKAVQALKRAIGSRLAAEGIVEEMDTAGHLVGATIRVREDLSIRAQRIDPQYESTGSVTMKLFAAGKRIDANENILGTDVPGFQWTESEANEVEPSFLRINSLYLKPETQGDGIGRALFDWLRLRALERGMYFGNTRTTSPAVAYLMLELLEDENLSVESFNTSGFTPMDPIEFRRIVDEAFQTGAPLPLEFRIEGRPRSAVTKKEIVVGSRLALRRGDEERAALLRASGEEPVLGARLVTALNPKQEIRVPIRLAAAVIALFTLTPASATEASADRQAAAGPVQVTTDLVSAPYTSAGERVFAQSYDVNALRNARPTSGGARLSLTGGTPDEDEYKEKTLDTQIALTLPAGLVPENVPAFLEVSMSLLSSIQDAEYFRAQFTDLVRGIVQYRGSERGRNDEFYLTGYLKFTTAQTEIAQGVIRNYRNFIRFGESPRGSRPVVRLLDPATDIRLGTDGTLHFPTSQIQMNEVAGWFGQITIAMTATKYFAKDGSLDVEAMTANDIPDEILEAYHLRSGEKPDKPTLLLILTGQLGREMLSKYRFMPVARYPIDRIMSILNGARLSILGSA